jgi:UDP-3-O-[3-hydroxymyristoyl] glucosamine N-acyltransferase
VSVTLGDLAERHDCVVRGDSSTRVSRVATLTDAGEDAISFLANPAYRKYLAETRAAAIILSPGDVDLCPTAALVTDNPYLVYARVAADLNPPPGFEPGVSDEATVEQGARISPSACVGPGSVIEQGAIIGEASFVGPGCIVGQNARLGRDCRLVAGVTICSMDRRPGRDPPRRSDRW